MKVRMVVLVLTGTFLLNGCSSCGNAVEENTNQGAGTKVIKPKPAANSGGMNISNSNLTTNRVPDNTKNPTLNNANVKIINTANAPVRLPARRLPDNSELTTTMNKEGAFVESRRFLNHPQLERLERIMKGPNDVKLQVRLRDGKVIEIPESKIKRFRFDSADTILLAVGVKPIKREVQRPNIDKEEMMKRKPIIRSPVNR